LDDDYTNKVAAEADRINTTTLTPSESANNINAAAVAHYLNANHVEANHFDAAVRLPRYQSC
jgi:hypothetical protein